jgi:hypothetical protein
MDTDKARHVRFPELFPDNHSADNCPPAGQIRLGNVRQRNNFSFLCRSFSCLQRFYFPLTGTPNNEMFSSLNDVSNV